MPGGPTTCEGEKVTMDDTMREHFPYEVEMLVCTFDRLVNPEATDRRLLSALIESFCVHARNLFEFFDKGAKIDNSPSYCREGYKSLKRGSRHGKMLNRQIAHLIHGGRFTTPQGKIDDADRLAMIRDLRDEVEHFKEWIHDKSWITEKWNIPAYVEGPRSQTATNTSTTASSEFFSSSSTDRQKRP
jgi:hypothetical protein